MASAILLGYNTVQHFGLSLGRAPSPAVYYLDLALWCLISVMGVVVGVLLVNATTAFKALIKTEGNDLEHLMSGMARLRDILGLVFWVATVASLLLTVSLLLLLTYSEVARAGRAREPVQRHAGVAAGAVAPMYSRCASLRTS